MCTLSAETWQTYADAFAFLGNTLLKPMTQTSPAGLDPEFWAAFPDFGSEGARCAADECGVFVQSLAGIDLEKAVEQVSVEYTRLFVGPPKPAAPPWETMYRGRDVTVGFGEATFEMRRLLREAGLQLNNENNQYEDHMGIELLYLSVLCRHGVEAAEAGDAIAAGLHGEVRAFASEHPLSWVDAFAKRVEEAFPEGYFSSVLALCGEVLRALVSQLQPTAK